MPPCRDQQSAAEWLARAEDDQSAGLKLVDLGHVALAAFHAQQAAEKGLKAVMIAQDIRIEKKVVLRWCRTKTS